MQDINVSQMMQMQMELYRLHEGSWSPMEPQYGRDFFLWMIEEIGEAVAVIKKKGDAAIVSEPGVRSVFLEEMADVLMYYTEILLRYGVTPEEIAEAYFEKHNRNMGRDYQKEYETAFQTQPSAERRKGE